MNNSRGFTLIELMIVVTIISVILASLLPTLAGREKQYTTSLAKATVEDIYTLQNAAVRYRADNYLWPPDFDTLKTNGYINPDAVIQTKLGTAITQTAVESPPTYQLSFNVPESYNVHNYLASQLVNSSVSCVAGDCTVTSYVLPAGFEPALDSFVLKDPNLTAAAGYDVKTDEFEMRGGNLGLTNGSRLGIGLASGVVPDASLHVAGNVKIVDGTQAQNYVLTSDADGLASWQPGGGLQSVQVFATPGTYTWNRPPLISKIRVQLVAGGGGGGGGSGGNAPYGRSGGGAGGYSEKLIDVTGIASVNVTVGAGGAGSVNNSGGGTGGKSSFGDYLSATGGQGSPAGYYPGSGGMGSGGDINIAGGDGHAEYGSNAGDDPNFGASGGSSFFGGGGKGGYWGGGAPGRAPGSGGGGGGNNRPGGAGAPGIVIVWEYK